MGHRHSVEKIRSLRRRRKSSSSKSEAAANDSRRRKHKAENCEIRAGLLKETEIKYIQVSKQLLLQFACPFLRAYFYF